MENITEEEKKQVHADRNGRIWVHPDYYLKNPKCQEEMRRMAILFREMQTRKRNGER